MDIQPRIFTDEDIKGTFLEFSLEDWKERGQRFSQEKDKDKWEIGDWLNEGEVRGRLEQEALRKYATEATGRPWGSLKNYKSLSAKIEKSRRRDDLSYDHHVKAAPYDPEIQDMLLDRASKGDPRNKIARPWSVSELQKAIKRFQDNGTIPKPSPKPKTENTTGAEADQNVVIHGKVSRKIHDFLRQLAAARGVKTPEILIWRMAVAYVEENKAKLQAEVDEHSAKRGAEFTAATLRDAPIEEELDEDFDKWFAEQEESEE